MNKPNYLIMRSQLAEGYHEINNILLHNIGKQVPSANLLTIGACDGVYDDLTSGWVSDYSFNVLFIEPIPDRCDHLKTNCVDLRGNITIVQCAISDENGSVDMGYIPTEYRGKHTPNGLYVHPALYGMSSIWPPKNGLNGVNDALVFEEIGVHINVPCRTLQSVLDEHQFLPIDLLSIDTEGHDFIILKQFDFHKYRPYWIQVELVNISDEDRASAVLYLQTSGYIVYENGQNGYAVRSDCVDWQN